MTYIKLDMTTQNLKVPPQNVQTSFATIPINYDPRQMEFLLQVNMPNFTKICDGTAQKCEDLACTDPEAGFLGWQ